MRDFRNMCIMRQYSKMITLIIAILQVWFQDCFSKLPFFQHWPIKAPHCPMVFFIFGTILFYQLDYSKKPVNNDRKISYTVHLIKLAGQKCLKWAKVKEKPHKICSKWEKNVRTKLLQYYFSDFEWIILTSYILPIMCTVLRRTR